MTQETARTQFINTNGIEIAYRRLGPSKGTPLLMVMHFRGNMDFWDPLLINSLIKTRPVILMDIPGTGKSAGTVPTSMTEWASHAINLIKALQIPQVDVLGFSMGGLAAQYVALDAPRGMVRKLILAGTRTSLTSKTVNGPVEWFKPLARSESEKDFKQAWRDSFFNHDRHGRAVAETVWSRIQRRSIDRAPHLSVEAAKNQIKAFSSAAPDARNPHVKQAADRLQELNIPVFVANGDNDLLIPTMNSWELAGLLKSAQLHIYPNAGHGFLFQYAELFAEHVRLFLDRDDFDVDRIEAKL